jgi:hypothetical protein
MQIGCNLAFCEVFKWIPIGAAEGEDRILGDYLAKWLIDELRKQDLETDDEPGQEDFGDGGKSKQKLGSSTFSSELPGKRGHSVEGKGQELLTTIPGRSIDEDALSETGTKGQLFHFSGA